MPVVWQTGAMSLIERIRPVARKGKRVAQRARAAARARKPAPRGAFNSTQLKTVFHAYDRALGRRPDLTGLLDNLRAVRRGVSETELTRRLATSSEARDLPTWWNCDDDDPAFIFRLYREYFDREPDSGGLAHYRRELQNGTTRGEVARQLETSRERVNRAAEDQAMVQFHYSRVEWMKSLPPARRILDLGGTAMDDRRGALLVMGYPHHFDELTIIELPPEDRHDLYKRDEHDDLDTPQGPVHYLYRSMCELDDIPDGSYDLVVSGQTFEHITQEEGRKLLKDVLRIVTPDGAFAIDTPNRALTAIACREAGADWINPDHEYEYTDVELRDLLEDAGWEIDRSVGIGHMPKTAATGEWWLDELLEQGLTSRIGESFTSAFLARPARPKS